MPTQSPYPPIDIPHVDLWEFLFERTDREFPDDKSRWFHFSLTDEANTHK